MIKGKKKRTKVFEEAFLGFLDGKSDRCRNSETRRFVKCYQKSLSYHCLTLTPQQFFPMRAGRMHGGGRRALSWIWLFFV